MIQKLAMQLGNHEVHLYTTALSLTPDEQQAMWQLLTQDEQARAMRFISPVHQQRFIAAHGHLRQLLAGYLNVAPRSIVFAYSSYQKPSLAKPHAAALQFNFSHSGNLAAYALTASGAIGVDIETIQSDAKLDVAERFFSPEEVSILQNADPADQARLFYQLWSRKEAIIKANGKGLAVPLSSFSVGISDTPATLTLEGETWWLSSLTLHPEFAAAVATAISPESLTHWEIINQQPVFKTSL